MDAKAKIAHCQFLINRFDVYMGGVNSKVAFYLTINTFILGGICIGYNSCKNCLHTWIYTTLLVSTALLLLCCLGSIYYTIRAVAPYLTDNLIKDDRDSLIFFGGIAKHQCLNFQDKFTNQDQEAVAEDFVRQVHSMACGLQRKFSQLNKATWFLLGEYGLLIVVIFLTFLILQ